MVSDGFLTIQFSLQGIVASPFRFIRRSSGFVSLSSTCTQTLVSKAEALV